MRSSHSHLRFLLLPLIMAGVSIPGGCSPLAGSSALTTFDLTAPSQSPAPGKTRLQIMIAEPAALSALDSERIMIRPGNGEITYLPGVQWADRLPRLIQARMIQTFENAHRIGMVGRPDDKFTPDVVLVSEIRDFQIEATPSPVAVVTLAVRSVSQTTGRIAAARLFTARITAAGTGGSQASAALNQALQQVLVDIVKWTTGRSG